MLTIATLNLGLHFFMYGTLPPYSCCGSCGRLLWSIIFILLDWPDRVSFCRKRCSS